MLEGVDITQTNMSCFRQQLARIATHILRCTGNLHPTETHTLNQDHRKG